MNQADAIKTIDAMLREDGHPYTFKCLAYEWPAVLDDAWTDISDNPVEWVSIKIPSSSEFRFRASLLRAALGQADR